ncbi:sulfite exporter TauE/SafE family protein [Ramlibacter sp.]|uniref:sulfite exporter TauE/SafE family protein n=1 Tax=Ramlibacter sp. TaxID=1917967 RepID=UPI0017D38F31|nr:sulfite exporter TauE/SafE family protein [Ramlibacter sp.]MBA2676410.1 sulfite exporter TauE/SafE family protein [Ramlibacter sp.]
MFHPDVPDFFAVCLIFFGAGTVKGVLGMGLPTLAMGLLGLVMPVAGAASLLTVPSLLTNVWQAAGRGLARTARRLWSMQVGIALGVALAPLLFPGGQQSIGPVLLGGCLVAYGALGLAGWQPKPPPARWQALAGLLAGASTGIVTGLTGVFVLPAVPYLQSLALGKDALSQALGLCFTTATIALGVLLAVQGHLDRGTSLASAVVVAPAVLGMVLGQAIRRQMSEALFRRCLFAGLLMLGSWLLMR